MHFGLIPNVSQTHVMSMVSLADCLRDRGHSITVFQLPDVEAAVLEAGHRFRPIGKNRYPVGSRRVWDNRYSQLTGLDALRFCITRSVFQAEAFFAEGPREIASAGVEALVIDGVASYGNAIAEHLKMPFVTVASALPVNVDLNQPPFFTRWRFRRGRLWRLRNRVGYLVLYRLARPLVDVVSQQRRAWSLPPADERSAKSAPRAEITQLPACVDFPRKQSKHLLYTGPFSISRATPKVGFPWQQLDGRALVYASMGTLQNGQDRLFKIIALACSGVDVQLVMSLGGGPIMPYALGSLPGNPIVVHYAPQRELIERSAVVISHCGVHTVLEALWYGVPIIAIPIANDQLGMAARVDYAGVGKVISPRRLSARRLRGALVGILSSAKYKQSAQTLQGKIRTSGGAQRAAEIIEKLLCESRPTIASSE
jgi:zeaxanthin glucosyltransferase